MWIDSTAKISALLGLHNIFPANCTYFPQRCSWLTSFRQPEVAQRRSKSLEARAKAPFTGPWGLESWGVLACHGLGVVHWLLTRLPIRQCIIMKSNEGEKHKQPSSNSNKHTNCKATCLACCAFILKISKIFWFYFQWWFCVFLASDLVYGNLLTCSLLKKRVLLVITSAIFTGRLVHRLIWIKLT